MQFVCVSFVLFLLFVVVLSGESKQNQGRGWVDRKLVQPPPPHTHTHTNFIAGCPMAAPLFWVFSDFSCGVPLSIVILVIYKYKNR